MAKSHGNVLVYERVGNQPSVRNLVQRPVRIKYTARGQPLTILGNECRLG